MRVKETKRQGRIAHHHADATVPHIVALLGFAFLLRTSAIQASLIALGLSSVGFAFLLRTSAIQASLIALGLSSVGFSFHAAKIGTFSESSNFFRNFFH